VSPEKIASPSGGGGDFLWDLPNKPAPDTGAEGPPPQSSRSHNNHYFTTEKPKQN